MLQFKHDTKVHALHSRGANIPTVSFNFCPFDQLPRKAIDSKPLLDIVGVISDVGPYDYASPTSQNKLQKIKIRNLDEQMQEVVLWGKHGESFDEDAVLKKSQEGIVIAIFAGITATSQKFTGTIQGSSSSAAQVYLDLNIPEVQQYRSSYQWKFPTLQKNLPKVAHLSPLEAAGKLYTIEQISTLPPTSFQGGATFSTIAKVTSIIPSVKWYYKACKRCGKGYNNMSDTPTCACQFPVPCPMYKLPLTLTDSSASLDAVAFSRVAEDLVERPAEQVSMNMKIDAEDQVLALDKAIGKERLFYIGMNIDSAAKYPIKYVLKKSFPVDNAKLVPLLTASKSAQDSNLAPTSSVINDESASAQQPEAPYNNTPPSDNHTPITTKESQSSSKVKRRIDFHKDDANNSNSSKSPESSLSKKQKQSENNKNAADNYEKTD